MTPIDPHLWWHRLPDLNGTLNGTAALLLLTAFVLIKRGQVVAHATFIILALITSTAFLVSYLLHQGLKHLHNEEQVHFPAGPWRKWYLALLISHTILAVVILPLIASTLWYAWKRRWDSHRKIAVITFPLWFYVSVTGVMIYFIVYTPHWTSTLIH